MLLLNESGSWLIHSAVFGAAILLFGSLVAWLCREPIYRIRIIHWSFVACLLVPAFQQLDIIPGYSLNLWGEVKEEPLSAVSEIAAVSETSVVLQSQAIEPRSESSFDHLETIPLQHQPVKVPVISEVEMIIEPELPAVAPVISKYEVLLRIGRAIQITYFAFVGFWFFIWMVGFVRRYQIAKQAKPADDKLRDILISIAGSKGKQVRLLVSNRVQTPIMWGTLRPTIIVPFQLAADPKSASLRWAMAHEWSHVLQGDFSTQLLASFTKFVCFYQPAYWWLRRQLTLSQDFLADAFAAKQGQSTEDYADFLVSIARKRNQPLLAGTLGINDRGSNLLRRVNMLVQSTRPLLQKNKLLPTLLITLFALLTVGGLSTVRLNAKPTENQSADTANASEEKTDPNVSQNKPQSLPEQINAPVKNLTKKLSYKEKVDFIHRLDGLKPTPQAIRVHLKLDRQEFFLGESIAVEYEMKNIGKEVAPYDKGGFYTGLRTNSEFPMTAVQIDDAGKPIGKPVALFEQPQDMGGMVTNWKLKPGESYSTVLFVTRVLHFSQPGRYRLQIKNIHAGTTVAYSSGETIITLKQPTTKQARSVFEQKKRAPRKAWDDYKMTYLKDAADFTTMHQAVYLPVLANFLSQGDDEALLSLGKMENMKASQVLVKSIEIALDRDDWQAARNCFQHMKQSLPFPNWYYDSARIYSKKDRDRVARSWQTGFRPVFIRLARRLTKAIASPANPTKPRDNLTQKQGQALLRDIDYIYKCIGEDNDFKEILNAFAISIELTRTLPFETHQYFRPRGTAYGFQHTINRLIRSDVKIPAKPKHTGEAAAFVMALYLHKPPGWQTEVMKWLKGDSPYLSELILGRLPEPIPAEVLEYLPTALTHDYIDLQIAACKVAQRHPQTNYKAPLKKILMTASDKYLIEFAVDAAWANGLKVKYNPDTDSAPVLLQQ